MTRDLGPLFDPRSVAVLGASNDSAKWGNWLARGALRGAHRRTVHLVNRNGGAILGQRTCRSLSELPEEVELVVVSVPASSFEAAIEASLAAGAKAIVGISAGLGEMGEEGRRREREIVERVRRAGAVLLGPNCLGVFDAEAELELGSNVLPSGSIGLISQSGNLALELGLLAEDYGIGFSRFASLGNQADLEAAELVENFSHHDPTRVIALYVEDFRDGRSFTEAAARATARGKPVLLLAGGGSAASARAARSHTGALVSSLAAVDAACSAAGVIRVDAPRELIDLAHALCAGIRPSGRRVAVLGDGGGHGVIAADVCASRGLELPELKNDLAAALAGELPPTAATRNPVDLAGGGEQDFWSYARAAHLLLESGEVDALVSTGYLGGYSQYSEEFREQEVEVARAMASASVSSARPLVVHTMYSRSDAAAALRAAGVPVYREIETAVSVLARLTRQSEKSAAGVPELPTERSALPDEASGYFEARELIRAAGIPFVEARRAGSTEEARVAARELGYPVVLKALGRLHKSDAGGVVIGIGSEDELERALDRLAASLAPTGYSVEEMAPLSAGVELILGVRRDRRFGPIALVGFGGLYAETLGDAAVALAPVSVATAEELIHSLRGSSILLGARGRPALALTAAAEALASLSGLAAAQPDVAEIEVNPLLVTADGACALDARIILEAKGEADAR